MNRFCETCVSLILQPGPCQLCSGPTFVPTTEQREAAMAFVNDHYCTLATALANPRYDKAQAAFLLLWEDLQRSQSGAT
jgi:hypothetical protein